MAEEAKVPAVPAPVPETYPDGSPIRKGAQSAEFWPTEAKALEIARGRTKGARRACIVKDKSGKVRYATTTHPHYLEEYILCTELGWEVTEIGKPAASKAPVTPDSILAAANSLPEAERTAILKQLEALLKPAKK
jgi:hypothetical protein